MHYDYFTIDYFPIIGSIFLLVFLWKNSHLEKNVRLLFYILLAVSNIELVTYNLELFLPDTDCSKELITLVTCIGYILRPLLMYMLVLLVVRDDTKRRKSFALVIPQLVNFVFSISGFFTDIGYNYDDDKIFHRGPLGWTSHIVMIVYLVMLLCMSFRRRKKEGHQFEHIIIAEIAFILTFGAFCESLFASMAILRISIITSIIFYYMFFQSRIYREEMFEKQLEQAKMFERFSYQVVTALAGTVDAKDSYTNGHSQRVADYAKEIAVRLKCSPEFIRDIYFMGLLHDIGKIGIPDCIINKTGKLTDEEYAVIKTHPVIGSEVLKKITEMPNLYCGARWHHERYDGKGYPDGISGEDIPLEARIIAVADAYDAMSSKRSYRDALPQAAVKAEIERVKGTQLDPKLAQIMLEMIGEDIDYNMKEH